MTEENKPKVLLVPRLDEILERMYRHEINCTIGWFWDSGFEVALGDVVQGWKARGSFRNVHQIAPWLKANAERIYGVKL